MRRKHRYCIAEDEAVIVYDHDPRGAGRLTAVHLRRARSETTLGLSTSAMGNQSSAVVPRPLWLVRTSRPPHCSARPCTIESPSPVPLPTPFVVKNGSTARARVASSIPCPVSVTDTQTKLPDAAFTLEASPLRADMVIVPPSGIASRALTTRFRRANSNWFASTRTGSSRIGKRVSICAAELIDRCNRSSYRSRVHAHQPILL